MTGALELESRRRIFEHVRRFPGAYFREIQRALGLQPGELEYHLRTLGKAGLLGDQEEGGRKRYFVAADVPHPDKPLLGLLRQAAVRRLLLALLDRPGISFQGLLVTYRATFLDEAVDRFVEVWLGLTPER